MFFFTSRLSHFSSVFMWLLKCNKFMSNAKRLTLVFVFSHVLFFIKSRVLIFESWFAEFRVSSLKSRFWIFGFWVLIFASHVGNIESWVKMFESRVLLCRSAVKGISRDHSRDNALNFHKIQEFCFLIMVFRCMNFTLKEIVKISPLLITKQHYILSLKKITGDYFQMDNQPTVDTNVTANHNIKQQDSLYILVEWIFSNTILSFPNA